MSKRKAKAQSEAHEKLGAAPKKVNAVIELSAQYAAGYTDRPQFTPAPNIAGVRFVGAVRMWGKPEDFIAAALAEEDWFAVWPKRVVYFTDGTRNVHSTRRARGIYEIYISQNLRINVPEPSGGYDGSEAVAWSDCAWKPEPVRVCQHTVHQIKKTLRIVHSRKQHFGIMGDLAEATLALIVQLEAKAMKR